MSKRMHDQNRRGCRTAASAFFLAEMRGSPSFFRVCEKNMKKSKKPLEFFKSIRYTEKAVT